MDEPSDWKQISAQLAREPAVFLVGVPRSGTTALRNTLERLEAFRPRSRPSPETRIFMRPDRIARILAEDEGPLLRFMLGDRDEAARLLENIAAFSASHRPSLGARAIGLLGPLGRTDALRVARWQLDGQQHLVRLFFHHARRARQTRRIFEKSPPHVTRLAEMRATFPAMQVLICLRHPIDVYSSYRKRLRKNESRGRPERETRWLRIAPDAFAREYRDLVACADRFRNQHPEQAQLIRYEDLTADPEQELRSISAFLGEPFDAGALIHDREEGRDRHGSPKLQGRIQASEKDWREWLEEDEARLIEDQLAETMAALEYTAHTSA